MCDNEPDEKHLDFIATSQSVVILLSPVKRQDFVIILSGSLYVSFNGLRKQALGIEDLRSRQMIMN